MITPTAVKATYEYYRRHGMNFTLAVHFTADCLAEKTRTSLSTCYEAVTEIVIRYGI